MRRLLGVIVAGLSLGAASVAAAAEISGEYVETRTCDVYTGPCFANGQMGLAGREAIMAWKIDRGMHRGVDVSGLGVVMAVRANDTLGFGGGAVIHPDPIQSVILVDERATFEQREALEHFARERSGRVGGQVVRVATAPIRIELDHVDMVARLEAGREVSLLTRQMAKGDCVCTNEELYYPPLTAVDNAAPAYTLQGSFNGRGLGVRWDNSSSRSTYLATFDY